MNAANTPARHGRAAAWLAATALAAGMLLGGGCELEANGESDGVRWSYNTEGDSTVVVGNASNNVVTAP